jgi:hypothetical protein
MKINGCVTFNWEGLAASTYNFQFVHVKNAGYLHMISDPVTEPSISFSTISLNIDGGGHHIHTMPSPTTSTIACP